MTAPEFVRVRPARGGDHAGAKAHTSRCGHLNPRSAYPVITFAEARRMADLGLACRCVTPAQAALEVRA